MNLNAQFANAQEAWHHAGEAQKALADIISANTTGEIDIDDLKDADICIRDFMRMITEIAVLLERKIRRQKEKWESVPILEAVIRCNGNERKIVISKPNDRIDEPHITESFWNAIRKKWNLSDVDRITTEEPYDIVVIDRKRREICRIEKS